MKTKNFNQIVSSIIERLSLTQPNLDVKPGTVSRDLFIDAPAEEISKLYSLVELISQKQSISLASGSDLDKLGSNFSLQRESGSYATGLLLFLSNTLKEDISIPSRTQVTSRSGIVFATVGNYIFSSNLKSKYASVASRYKKALQVAGINATYAIEVPIQCIRVGTSGNVSSLQIINHNLQSDIRCINLSSLSGGKGSETDASYRARINSIFYGSNIGTSSGYKNACLSVSGVLDALVVSSGNPLMIRDGSQYLSLDDGTKKTISSGVGGKVDIYILGKSLKEVSESFVFRDKSGTSDATNIKNDFIFGSSSYDFSKTSLERRYDAFKSGVLPPQPVYSISSVTGSKSGLLSEKTISNGVVSGNYELTKDTNPDTSGSAFSLDRLHFISNEKKVVGEQLTMLGTGTKGQPSISSSQISAAYKDILISGENSSSYLSDKNYIKLIHTPVYSISKIQNKSTGEIYSISSQTLDSNGLNNSGLVKISGKSLPAQTDILSVDYVWRKQFENGIDYNDNSPGFVDWGNPFKKEVLKNIEYDGTKYFISLETDIASVDKVLLFEKETLSVTTNTNSLYESSFKIETTKNVNSILSIKTSSGLDILNTTKKDSSFSGKIIYLPTDSIVEEGDSVIVIYNDNDIYNIELTDSSFSGKTIYLPSEDIMDGASILSNVIEAYNLSYDIMIFYTEKIYNVIPTTSLSLLPASGIATQNYLTDASSSTITSSSQPIEYVFDSNDEISSLQRFSPATVTLSLSNSVSPGKIRISGSSIYPVTLSSKSSLIKSGLSFNLKNIILSYFSISEVSPYSIIKINKIYTKDDSGTIDYYFDLYGSKIYSNIYDSNCIGDTNLAKYEITLNNNDTNTISISSAKEIYFDILILKENDFEDVYFSENKTMYGAKRWARINKISVLSGFKNSTGSIAGNVSVGLLTGPAENSTYNIDYSFVSPIEGERITVKYMINNLILDVSNAIESYRPIAADVLVKQCNEIKVDVSCQIVIDEDQLLNGDSIVDSVANAISNALSTNSLNKIIDYSDIISVIKGVSGVDSVNISLFNLSGNTGRKAYIKSLENETITPGNINVEAVSRKNFRIT